ncbi:phage portal protein [Streptococcus constellatus]|jgi:HK97 family phage portal protein|uniref:phage portal protein n=1 Tax=Streptococcus constellatus TaxID=76860 RepID=UPI0021073F2E|nr:phage portal protein [Streptococcus constellatus]UTX64446.1 phage portal protein [Streptococcus constellatus]
MGIFERFRKRNKNPTIQFLSHQDFGLRVSDSYTPLGRNPDVLIAVNKIADLVSNMTIYLMENTDKGDKRVLNELSRKIDIGPCHNMTRKSWVYKIVRDLLLFGDGNSVVHVQYHDGFISNLLPFPMSQVSYKMDNSNGYKIVYNNQEYGPDEVIHFVMNPDPDSYFQGTGYRVALRDIVSNLNQATKTKNDFMRNKMLPSMIIKVDAFSETLSTEEGRNNLLKKYFESSKAGQPWLVSEDMFDIQQVKPLTLNDIAINDSVELDKKTVAGLIGVPAFLLGVGTFNKEEYNNFINGTIKDIALIISQTLTRDLLYSPNMYFKLNARSLYSYNLTELVTAGTSLVDRNAMRRNELRGWLDLAPDDEMEDLLVLENYLPADRLGDQKKLKGGETDNDET